MIKLQLIGHLGSDAVLSNVNGKNVINMNVAVTTKFKDAQGVQKENTQWFSTSYWSERTAIAPYLKKGTLVYLEGGVEAKIYKNKDGVQVPQLAMRVNNIQLLGGTKPQATEPSDTEPPF